MPPIVGPCGGAGEAATAACRTGLPLNLLGSEAAGAAAPGFAADISRTFCRNSAFSFSILSSHAIECCRSRRTAERDQAKSSTSRPGKKLIPHDVSPFAKLSRQQAGTPLNGAMLGYTRCQIHRLTRGAVAIMQIVAI